ncbi:transferase [Acetobacter syzygii]|uniref:acetyltransferase n=1 Tax=Acetobacter syzygii TaxID=146476 RepID=UPI0005E4F407|nr:acetyltransferase [Acetobacter syzygii]GAN70632.1 acetyltransferase [Acetobacter syzygii]GBR65664.1 acetyltransferase [Acetobacter syzygii NRIC 0483]GEL55480.1 transferase [Acetobacter syzygii]
MAEYILVGGGGFARELYDWFTPSLTASGSRFIGYLDDGADPLRAYNHPLPQLGTIAGYKPASPDHRLVMAIGSPAGKQKIVGLLGPEQFATLIHPTAWVSASSTIHQGAIVGVFADISANATVGEFATVNGYGSVGHDATLGPFATISGYVDLTGNSTVGKGSFVGSGARVLPHVHVGEHCTIGAGAVVVRSTQNNVTMYTPPARKL